MSSDIKHKYPAIIFLGFGLLLQTLYSVTAQEIACQAPEPVCFASASVFAISSYDPLASAVRIGPKVLVTNRHVTADQIDVTIFTKTGARVSGQVIATAYEGDLVLIRAENLPDGPVLPMVNADENSTLYTIGADISRRKIRVYKPGKIILKPSITAPFARLYHTALTSPGNSGGALVNAQGQLVGIVTSGGEGRFEAFPASAVDKLRSLSGDQYREKSKEIGAAVRACMDFQDGVPRRSRLSRQMAQELIEICSLSNNRQLMDNAAVMLGTSRYLKLSRQLLEQGLKRDPQAINTRLSLITVLTFAGLNKAALLHIRRLLPIIPEDRSLQRYAIRAGKLANDMALAKEGLALVKKYDPAQAEAAARFLNAPLRQHDKPKPN